MPGGAGDARHCTTPGAIDAETQTFLDSMSIVKDFWAEPTYADTLQFAVVHHTAGSNDYTGGGEIANSQTIATRAARRSDCSPGSCIRPEPRWR